MALKDTADSSFGGIGGLDSLIGLPNGGYTGDLEADAAQDYRTAAAPGGNFENSDSRNTRFPGYQLSDMAAAQMRDIEYQLARAGYQGNSDLSPAENVRNAAEAGWVQGGDGAWVTPSLEPDLFEDTTQDASTGSIVDLDFPEYGANPAPDLDPVEAPAQGMPTGVFYPDGSVNQDALDAWMQQRDANPNDITLPPGVIPTPTEEENDAGGDTDSSSSTSDSAGSPQPTNTESPWLYEGNGRFVHVITGEVINQAQSDGYVVGEVYSSGETPLEEEATTTTAPNVAIDPRTGEAPIQTPTESTERQGSVTVTQGEFEPGTWTRPGVGVIPTGNVMTRDGTGTNTGDGPGDGPDGDGPDGEGTGLLGGSASAAGEFDPYMASIESNFPLLQRLQPQQRASFLTQLFAGINK